MDRHECPFCCIPIARQWTEGSFETDFSRYARCQQCGCLFLLTTAGWEEETEWVRYGLEFPQPREEPAW